jgi:glycine cleavage system transcriptional repressor
VSGDSLYFKLHQQWGNLKTMSSRTNRYVITVLAQDRVGIIADVSEILFQLGGNLEALSQTVVWGWFTMIICAAFPEEVTAAAVRETLEKKGEFAATVVPLAKATPSPRFEGEPFVVTAFGEDKPGIVRKLTASFARRGINIEDVWNEVQQGKFIVIFHVTIPDDIDPKDARNDLEEAAREVGVTVTMQHQDIFTATNSLSLHTRLPRRNTKLAAEKRDTAL